GLKRSFVRALVEHLLLEGVTLGANVFYCVHTRGRSAMVSMAGRASRRAQIATDGQRIVMHAAGIFRKLIRGDRIALHVRPVGVTPGASLRDVEGMNLRARVTDRP